MTQTVADRLVEVLQRFQVAFLFGRSSEGISGIVRTLQNSPEQIRYIPTRQDSAAALMASGYARFTSKLGVCMSAGGSAGIQLMNGLYDAKLDHLPLLAITGSPTPHRAHNLGQHEIALDRLYVDAALYNSTLSSPAQLDNRLGQACRAAVGHSGVAHLNIPLEIQNLEFSPQQPEAVSFMASQAAIPQRMRPSPEGDLRQAIEILNTGERIVILVGRGALHADAEILAVAGKLGAPVVKTLMGKGVVPDTGPYSLGCLGPYGTPVAHQAIKACDTLLMVGATFSYADYLPDPTQVNIVQIDADLARVGLHTPVRVGIIGDSQRSLRDLLPHLKHHTDQSFQQHFQQEIQGWYQKNQDTYEEEKNASPTPPMKPQQLAWLLGQLLPENALLACDVGPAAAWWGRYVQVKAGQIHVISGNLAAPGCSLPYAMAGQAAFPQAISIAFTGSQNFAIHMGELITCVRENLPVKTVIINESPPGEEAPDYVLFAQACGAVGRRIKSLPEAEAVFEECLAVEGPAIIEIQVDPAEVP